MRHTSTIVAVPSQADTQLSSIGVTWSTNALGAWCCALECKTAAASWSDRASSFPGTGKRTVCYVQLDVMRMPKPKEFRRLRPHRATPFPPNLAFPNPNLDPNLDRRGFSRASCSSVLEMQLSPSKTDWTLHVSVLKRSRFYDVDNFKLGI